MKTPKLLTAVSLSTAIAAVGYRRRALSASGAAGAVLVGASTYRAGGWRWSGVLLAFFASSSALSRRKSGTSTAAEASAAMNERGSRRDVVQVLANGGVASALALAYAAGAPGGAIATGFAGALAAANADTWATEIGGASPVPPRHILTGAVVPPGTSGGVTVRGLLGAVGGAAATGLASGLLLEPEPSPRRGTIVATAGLVGSLVDSVVGGTLQASYRCPGCGESTERRIHLPAKNKSSDTDRPNIRCGMPAVLVRGYAWCTNDVVNVVCTGAGGAGALVAAWLLDRNR